MLSKILTGSLSGLESTPVTVETDFNQGLPALNMVGLASITVKEAGERIRSAIINTGYAFPCKRITINFSPAATRKEGSHFDLAIAIGILTSAGVLEQSLMKGYAFLGELSLDGAINRIKGALPLVIGLRNCGIKKIILPESNLSEAAIVNDIALFPASHLSQVIEHIQADWTTCARLNREKMSPAAEKVFKEDYNEVYGQENVKRIMEVCAAGFHGLLMIGSPGSGKSMMARRLPTIMADMTYEEILETTQIYSIAGELSEKVPVIKERPFRAPHHTISSAALIGGGSKPRPGEISLAHGGVLFLDELPEFHRRILELLRQPIENGYISINRQFETLTFPGRTILMAASNPCPCGHRGDKHNECTCSEGQVHHYMSKLSAPLLERIDMQVSVRRVDYAEFVRHADGEAGKRVCKSSAEMRACVKAAVDIQRERYRNENILYNAQLPPALIRKFCRLDRQGSELMKEAYEKMSLSARSYHKILKVARTISDLSGTSEITASHLAEAIQYRRTGKG